MTDVIRTDAIAGDEYGYSNGSTPDDALISPWSSTNLTGDYIMLLDMLMKDESIQDLKRMGEISNIVVPITTILILVFGLIANALVIYITLVTDRTTNHPIHSMFVLNLAVADIVSLLVSGPYWITINATSTWRFGSFLCSFIPFLSVASTTSSIYTICALAWMRFMALTMPFRFRRSRISTRKAGYIVLMAIWIAGAALSIPYLTYMRIIEENIQGHQVIECRWDGRKASRVFSCVLTIFTYILPFITVSIFYTIIGREVLCFMRNYGDGSRSSGKAVRTEDEKEHFKSTMVVLGLIVAFLICWFPQFFSNFVRFAGFMVGDSHMKGRFILHAVAKCMGYAHACVSPIVYTFASPIFRRELRRSMHLNCHECKCKDFGQERTGFAMKIPRIKLHGGRSSGLSSDRSISPCQPLEANGQMYVTISYNEEHGIVAQADQAQNTTLYETASISTEGPSSVPSETTAKTLQIPRLSPRHEEDAEELHALLGEAGVSVEVAKYPGD